MGNVTGFMNFPRVEESYEPVRKRVKNFREFVFTLAEDEAKVQSARCMDCGTPFCNSGCPVNNIIPDFNDLVYRGDWKRAFEVLDSTNNFPEFTGRICPAPCEAACVLNINADAVGIKSIEHAIIDRAWAEGWVVAKPATAKTGKTVAVIGSGPAGLAAAQQLARAGHAVTVFERNDAIGGLLRYGIPDFKMEKTHIDRRAEQMRAEGVVFRTGVRVGDIADGEVVTDWSSERISAGEVVASFDAVVLAGGAERSRDLPVPGRDLAGIHYAMEFLPQQNKVNAGGEVAGQIRADGKHVVVIGGGDTGSDCVGTSNRHGARSVTQFELLPMPPEQENKPLVWPYWPVKLRTSSSHEEGCEREFAIATREFSGEGGVVKALKTVRVDWQGGRMVEVPGSEETIPADLVLLAMGFTSPLASVLEAFGVERDGRGNARATTDADTGYATGAAKVFAAGDMRRGQSLVVWAIREGRQAAREVDAFLMGGSAPAALTAPAAPASTTDTPIPRDPDTLVEVDRVVFGYEGSPRTILDDVSMTFGRGKVTAILGGSGSGKTTLLRLIGGVHAPRSGVVRFDGEEVDRAKPERLFAIRRRLGMLFQFGALFTDLSVFDNVAFPLREHTDIGETMIRDIVLMKLNAVGLRGAAALRIGEISGGMARRVALARAIALDPELLLYDEPFTGLDPISLAVAANLIRTLNEVTGATSILVSHDVQECFRICDYAYLMSSKGKVLTHGTPQQLMDSEDPQVRQFIRGEADGPVPFHYPAPPFAEELGVRA